MAVTNPGFCAVVMGDLVHSERAPSIEQLHRHFNAAVKQGNRDYRTTILSPLTITLGDEFQGLAMSLSATIPLIRAIRFALLANAIECRFAVGVVELKTPLNTSRAWNMMGSGLSRTRTKLNEKRAVSNYRFAVTDGSALETALEALGAGLTSIERRWTERQRNDIVELMAGASAGDLAKRRNVSVHTIYKVRQSGDFEAYALQWQAVADVLAEIDHSVGMV